MLEERIAALAARQHGVVTRSQLFELGMSPSALGRALAAERLCPFHPGVYLVGRLKFARSPEMAAVLTGGSGAALSHASAIWAWNLLRRGPPRPIHVTTPGVGRRPKSGVVFHRTHALADDERTVVDGIPVTTPARTIVDSAGVLGRRELELAVATAEREGLIGGEELAALPDRYAGRAGMPLLRAVLADPTGPGFTRSEAERRCLDLLRDAGLPSPRVNVPLGPYELDIFWPQEKVAIEVDGHEHHSSRRRFEADRKKDNWLRVREIEVIRLTWRQITDKPTATVAIVAQTLALARARRASSGGDRNSA